jgi:hypothetical protein
MDAIALSILIVFVGLTGRLLGGSTARSDDADGVPPGRLRPRALRSARVTIEMVASGRERAKPYFGPP